MPCEHILLVGGDGFIGRALGRRLAAEGREVHVLSRHTDSGAHDGVFFHRGCQADSTVIGPLLQCCDAVVHLAAATTPGHSAHSPLLDVVENLAPFAAFLEALAAAGSRRVIFLSSGGAIYGNPSHLPARENYPLLPLSYHAAGKAAAELLLGVFARQSSDTSLAIVRPSNVYGPGQPVQAGFGIVRTLLEKARCRAPVDIWGSGRQVRDFLYIDDLVDVCTTLLDKPSVRGTFNAGSGVGVSLLELIELVQKVTRQTLSIRLRPERGIDVEGIYLDCSQLREASGWTATTTLADGLERTWTWLQEQ